jgi:hypothetical protein
MKRCLPAAQHVYDGRLTLANKWGPWRAGVLPSAASVCLHGLTFLLVLWLVIDRQTGKLYWEVELCLATTRVPAHTPQPLLAACSIYC